MFLIVFSPKDKDTRKPRGFTFCQYKRKEDAEEAVKGMDKRVKHVLHHMMCCDMNIHVHFNCASTFSQSEVCDLTVLDMFKLALSVGLSVHLT